MNYEMTPEGEQEYRTRPIWVDTDFKNCWCLLEAGKSFKQKCWKGTREQYDKLTQFYNDHSNGKIIGEHIFYKYSDWLKAHPEFIPNLIKYTVEPPFGYHENQLKNSIRAKISRGEKIGKLEHLAYLGKI